MEEQVKSKRSKGGTGEELEELGMSRGGVEELAKVTRAREEQGITGIGQFNEILTTKA